MSWRLYVVTGSLLAAGLGVTGWTVSASANVPSPDLGPPVVVSPAAREAPRQPAEAPDASQASTRKPGAAASRSPSVAPPDDRDRQTNPPETIPPRWIEPPQPAQIEPDRDEDEDEDEDSAEVDDD